MINNLNNMKSNPINAANDSDPSPNRRSYIVDVHKKPIQDDWSDILSPLKKSEEHPDLIKATKSNRNRNKTVNEIK